jgi:hypothetical protein
MYQTTTYCLVSRSQEQVGLLVLDRLRKLSVDVIRKRVTEDISSLVLFQLCHSLVHVLEIYECDNGRAAGAQAFSDGLQEIVVETKVDEFAGGSTACCAQECAFDESST